MHTFLEGIYMSKQNWDGRFDSPECKYKYTGNIVNDVIENGGRILHEPTSDGFTHEITLRNGYTSDDYYFPNPARSNGHDHYELHSTGDIVINGKKITTGGTRMGGKVKRRTRNPESAHVRKQETEETQSEYSKIHELGTKFEADRAELDRTIEAIEMSDATDEYKEKARAKYEYAVEKLKEKYDRDVKEEEQKLEQELIEQEESAIESSQEHKKVAEETRKSKFEVSDVDMSEAAELAEQAALEMENIAKATADKRKLLKEQADIQRRNVRAQRLRSRN
jgi:hypothetical protein